MSAPAPVSIREFAKLDGCDDKLVRRALTSGKLKAGPDGKLDPALAGSAWRKRNRRAAEGADNAEMSAPNVRTPVPKPARSRKAPPSAEELEEALDAIDDEGAGDFLSNLLEGRFALTGRAEQIKENGLAAKHLIAARKDAGNLIEVDRAEAVMFEAARAARDAWQGFPTRIGPLLAADLDVDADRVVEALTVHVQQQLEQLGQPRGDFRTQQ